MELQYDYNLIRPSEGERRQVLLKEIFAEIGEGCYIEPPLHANWGGHHVHLGKNVYANFGLTLVDDTHIYIGNYTMIGPNVVLATAGYPIVPDLREQGYQYMIGLIAAFGCYENEMGKLLLGIDGQSLSSSSRLYYYLKDQAENMAALEAIGWIKQLCNKIKYPTDDIFEFMITLFDEIQ